MFFAHFFAPTAQEDFFSHESTKVPVTNLKMPVKTVPRIGREILKVPREIFGKNGREIFSLVRDNFRKTPRETSKVPVAKIEK